MKIRPVGAELFRAGLRAGGRADGRTDMKKLIVAFRNFASAPKTSSPASEIKKNPHIFPTQIVLRISYDCHISLINTNRFILLMESTCSLFVG